MVMNAYFSSGPKKIARRTKDEVCCNPINRIVNVGPEGYGVEINRLSNSAL
jgi:hypothetical protein